MMKRPRVTWYKGWVAPVAIIAIGLLMAGAIWFVRRSGPPPAVASLSACQSTETLACYKAYLAAKVKNDSAVAAVNDLRAAYTQDSYAAAQCHELTHAIGHAAFEKYGSIAKAYTKGDGFCWSGYYHGVTEEAIGAMGADKVKQQANSICADLAASKRYSFDHYNCAHGLGHGFMAVENFNLFNALKTCDTLQDNWERESCYGGVFMENVMVAVRGDGSSEYLKSDQPLYPCTAVDQQYKLQCYLMQTSYALKQNGYNFAQTFVLCRDMKDGAFVDTCYESIGRDAAGSVNSDIQRTKTHCSAAPSNDALKICIAGAVRNIVSYYHSDTQARDFCELYDPGIKSDCLAVVTSYYATF